MIRILGACAWSAQGAAAAASAMNPVFHFSRLSTVPPFERIGLLLVRRRDVIEVDHCISGFSRDDMFKHGVHSERPRTRQLRTHRWHTIAGPQIEHER